MSPVSLIVLLKSNNSNLYAKAMSRKSMKISALFMQTVLYLFNKQLENRRHFHSNFIHTKEKSPARR